MRTNHTVQSVQYEIQLTVTHHARSIAILFLASSSVCEVHPAVHEPYVVTKLVRERHFVGDA